MRYIQTYESYKPQKIDRLLQKYGLPLQHAMLMSLFVCSKNSNFYLAIHDGGDDKCQIHIHKKYKTGSYLDFYYGYFDLDKLLRDNNKILINQLNYGKSADEYRELGELIRESIKYYEKKYNFLIDNEEIGLI